MNKTTPAPAYGTLDWAIASNGRLTAREQLRESAKALRSVSASAPGTVRALRGRSRSDATAIDLLDVVVPDSAIARAALEEARDSVADPVVQHSLRMYYFAMMLAARDRLSPDPEIVYVASLLHDITWGDAHRDYSPMPCFAARGAEFALAWTTEQGWPPGRARVAADGISLHVNITVGPEHTDEARSMASGVGLDVVGLRFDELDRSSVAAVVAQHPRTGWIEATANFRHEARKGTRAGLMRRLGMLQLAKRTPFGD